MRRLAIAALALVLLTGCGQYASPYFPASPPETDDLIGTWIHAENDTSEGATLTLNADGTLKFDSIPSDVIQGNSGEDYAWRQSSNLVSGEGTWIFEPGQTVFDRLHLYASFNSEHQADAASTWLDFGTGVFGASSSINFIIGDPDQGEFYRLTRDTAAG